MTYNVFGGTLNLAQSKPCFGSVWPRSKLLMFLNQSRLLKESGQLAC